MLLFRRIAIIVALFATGACLDPSSGLRSDLPPDGIAAYFPVSVGNRWVYSTADGEGQQTFIDTITVTTVEGSIATLEHREHFSNQEIRGYTLTYRVAEDGITRVALNGVVSDTGLHLIRAPISAGTEWRTRLQILRIATVDTTVNTMTGIFTDVIVVQTQTCMGCTVPGSIWRSYYAKGIGLVKHERYSYDALDYPPFRTQSLISYGR
jgi:hypothetical protein